MKRAMPFGGLDNIKKGLKIVNYTFFQPNLSIFQPKTHLLRLFFLKNYRFLE